MQRGVSGRTVIPAGAGWQGWRWTERYAGAVGNYMARICRGRRARRLTHRALDELSGVGGEWMSAADAATIVGRVARRVAFAELDRAGRRARRLLALRWQCARTPAVLRKREASGLSEHRVERFHRHLACCDECASIVGRYDRAEWYLRLELAMPGERFAGAAGGSRPGRRAPGGAGLKRDRAVGPRLRIAAAGLGLSAMAAAGVALALSGGAHTVGRPAAQRGAALSLARGSGAAVVRGLRAPFVVGGARYAVFVNPKQPWTGFARSDAGPGRRWVLVTVAVRALAVAGVDPRALDFRLVDRHRVAFDPEPAIGTPALRLRSARPLPRGERVESHLAFRIPTGATGLRLHFRSEPAARPIVVGLGG